jgi:cohesin loading factor subunit SCC2
VQSKIASGIITLQGQVCKYIPRIVQTLSAYMRDKNSSNLRSRSMSGVEALVHKDPRVITEDNARNMIEVLSDTSPKVRESALNFVATCLSLNPALEKHFLPSILRLTVDPSNGPKKKAIKLLKDVYNATSSRDNKLKIIANLLLPSQDDEKAISELSRTVLEEILLTHTKSSGKRDESQLKFERSKRATLIIDTVQLIQTSPVYLEAFEKFFIHALSPEAKATDSNSNVCKDLVADMIDEVISPGSGSDTQSQSRTMTALSIFARVQPTLFTVDQIQLLKLYIKEVENLEDLQLLRPAVIIFRYVIATLQSLQQTFAEEVRASLMKNVSRLANWASAGRATSRETLVDVAHCLWTVTPMAPQGDLKLCVTITSIICQLRPLASCTKEQATQARGKITSYLILLGTFGKVCNLDQYADIFRERLVMRAHDSVAKKQATAQQVESLLKSNTAASLVLLNTVRPFTMQTWDMSIREQALQSVGGICHQSPALFMRGEIEKVFQLLFINGGNDGLKRVALATFNEYFAFAERRSETGAAIAVGQGAVTGNARLDASFATTAEDTAPLHLAQRFMSDLVKTALESENDLTILATGVITSISRQGLIHPKACGAALVALSTSLNDRIAQPAAVELKRIHEKSESILEKEYMESVRVAFTYQSEVCKDSHGMREATHTPKLIRFFEALKSGKKATFKKFIGNLCKHIDFDPSNLDVRGDELPEPVLFARFCLENLALLDFPHLEELSVCLNAVEAIVLKTTGPIVALAIETEMPKRQVAVQPSPAPDTLQQQLGDAAGAESSFASFMKATSTAPVAQPSIADARLRQITASCMILQMVWETRTFIRRCYTLQKYNGHIPQKEFAKPAQRNNFVSGKELWDRLSPIMSALDDREAMVKICYDFAELLEVDREAHVGDESDEDTLGTGYETPGEVDDAVVAFPTSGRGRKRKSNASLGNTPKKARGRPAKNKKRNSRTPEGDDDSD